jgi:hypothetical protein
MKIIFTRRNTLISNSIAIATNSEVSHVAILHSDGDTVTEARGDGQYNSVIGNSLKRILADPDLVGCWIATPKMGVFPSLQASDEWLISQRGKRYDYFNTLFIQVVNLFRRKGSIFQRCDKQAGKKWQCAELGTAWSKLYAYAFPPGVVIGHQSPATLYDLLLALEWDIIKVR